MLKTSSPCCSVWRDHVSSQQQPLARVGEANCWPTLLPGAVAVAVCLSGPVTLQLSAVPGELAAALPPSLPTPSVPGLALRANTVSHPCHRAAVVVVCMRGDETLHVYCGVHPQHRSFAARTTACCWCWHSLSKRSAWKALLTYGRISVVCWG